MNRGLYNGQTNANVLVTGGAGYIGSHTCKYLASRGFLPVSYDDLSTGNRSSVRWGPLVIGDIGDTRSVAASIRRYQVSAVVHFAASAYVAESVTDPRKYFENNLIKTISLLNVLVDEGVKDFVFSSTCAIYGVPERLPISESHPKAPVNPYGESKLAIERVLRWYGEAYGLKWISLRYFNAAGADPDGEIGENHPIETHLIPSIFGSLASEAKALPIFGRDYPTRDGTAIRDYVHVSDLARAHGLALDSLRQNRGNRAYNLGTGNGYSVQEIVNIIEQVTGQRPRTEDLPGRKGDPPILIADASLANEELGWIPQHSRLDEMVSTAWQWHRAQKRDSVREVVAGS